MLTVVCAWMLCGKYYMVIAFCRRLLRLRGTYCRACRRLFVTCYSNLPLPHHEAFCGEPDSCDVFYMHSICRDCMHAAVNSLPRLLMDGKLQAAWAQGEEEHHTNSDAAVDAGQRHSVEPPGQADQPG